MNAHDLGDTHEPSMASNSPDAHNPTSHTTTLHDAMHLPSSLVPKEKDREKVAIENTSIHSTLPSPSETRNPSKVDLQGGGGGTTERKKDLEKGDEKGDVIIVDWDGKDDPCNPLK